MRGRPEEYRPVGPALTAVERGWITYDDMLDTLRDPAMEAPADGGRTLLHSRDGRWLAIVDETDRVIIKFDRRRDVPEAGCGYQEPAVPKGGGGGARHRRYETADDLLAAASSHPGVEIERRTRHAAVLLRGAIVTTVPLTPSDWRSLKNCAAKLRRSGIDV